MGATVTLKSFSPFKMECTVYTKFLTIVCTKGSQWLLSNPASWQFFNFPASPKWSLWLLHPHTRSLRINRLIISYLASKQG